MKMAQQWGDQIPIGVIYQHDRPSFGSRSPVLGKGPLIGQNVNWDILKNIMKGYE
jgi:2-oxoglutarate ferredoxin oxidoreductase subunit beta